MPKCNDLSLLHFSRQTYMCNPHRQLGKTTIRRQWEITITTEARRENTYYDIGQSRDQLESSPPDLPHSQYRDFVLVSRPSRMDHPDQIIWISIPESGAITGLSARGWEPGSSLHLRGGVRRLGEGKGHFIDTS